MSNEKIVFHGGVQVASFEGRDWVPEADYATLGEALTRMNEKAAKLERELTRYRDPAMVLVAKADIQLAIQELYRVSPSFAAPKLRAMIAAAEAL